jgi:glycosyltransferase involved in cell wall biosynthesis
MVDASAGTERVVLEIARIQARRGEDVTVASMGPTAWRGSWEGVTLRHFALCPVPKLRSRGAVKELWAHLNLTKCIRFGRFDLVHLHEYRKTRFFEKQRMVMHFHNNPLDGVPDAELAQTAAPYWQEIGKAGAQIAVSSFVGRRLQLTHGSAGAAAPSANIVVNQSGVGASLMSSEQRLETRKRMRSQLGLKDSDVLFMFAGAVRSEKGVVQLAQAFSKLAAEHANAFLVIAGGAKLWANGQPSTETAEQQVHAILAAEVTQRRAALVGIVSPALLPAYYAAADVFMLPSMFQETFGLVILEAFAAHLPVIGARSGGVPELVEDNQTGLLVDQGDVIGLFDAMRRLLLDGELRERLGTAAGKIAANMPWENTVDRLELIYRSVLSLL